MQTEFASRLNDGKSAMPPNRQVMEIINAGAAHGLMRALTCSLSNNSASILSYDDPVEAERSHIIYNPG